MKKQSQKSKKRKSQKKKNYSPRKNEDSKLKKSEIQKRPENLNPPKKIAKKNIQKRGGEGSSISKLIKKAGQFLKESKIELKKVKWPTRKELIAATAVVIILSIFVAFFLGLVDFGLIKIIKKIVG